MPNQYSVFSILKRLYWDIVDKDERQYLFYSIVCNLPSQSGSMIRSRFISKRAESVGDNLKIYSGAKFRSIERLRIGHNLEIGNDNFIQALGGVKIGNNVSLAPGVKIWSTNHNVKDKNMLIQDQGLSESEITIGNDVFIGANSIILPGVNLPDGVVVTAGSVVGVKAYKPYSIISGNPARIIGYRE